MRGTFLTASCLPPLSKMMPSSLHIPSSLFGTLSRLLGASLPGAHLLPHPSGLFFGGNTVSFHHFSFQHLLEIKSNEKNFSYSFKFIHVQLKFCIFFNTSFILHRHYTELHNDIYTKYKINLKTRIVQTWDWLNKFLWLVTSTRCSLSFGIWN